jgi:hypothetical protein
MAGSGRKERPIPRLLGRHQSSFLARDYGGTGSSAVDLSPKKLDHSMLECCDLEVGHVPR